MLLKRTQLARPIDVAFEDIGAVETGAGVDEDPELANGALASGALASGALVG